MNFRFLVDHEIDRILPGSVARQPLRQDPIDLMIHQKTKIHLGRTLERICERMTKVAKAARVMMLRLSDMLPLSFPLTFDLYLIKAALLIRSYFPPDSGLVSDDF